MIHKINGSIAALSDQQMVIDCESMSFLCNVPSNIPVNVGQKATIHTYLHFNSEQGPSLFGFSSELERTVFLLIISCSGLGPKIALTILSDLGAQSFLKAVQTGDESALTQVSGIGAKKAEQIIVQLKHKVAKLLETGVVVDDDNSLKQFQTVSQVLQSLNYSRPEISGALKYVSEQTNSHQMPFDQIMRVALSFLAKKT